MEFLEISMYRGVAGIDPGSEDPLGRALANYLCLINLSQAPDALVKELSRRHGMWMRYCLQHARAL